MDVDFSRWGELERLECVTAGNRNEVWRGSMGGTAVSIRRSRRALASLEWELDLIEHLDRAGFRVPTVVGTIDGQRSRAGRRGDPKIQPQYFAEERGEIQRYGNRKCSYPRDGQRHVDGVVVQRWLEGRPPESPSDWRLVANTLERLHDFGCEYLQRPGCCPVTQLDAEGVSVDADMSALPDEIVDEILAVFATFTDAPVSLIHGDPGPSNIRIDEADQVGFFDFDESRVDVTWHDLSNLGIAVLDGAAHRRAQQLSHAWEAVNAWTLEPEYAQRRLLALRTSLGP